MLTALMMEAVNTFETSVNVYETATFGQQSMERHVSSNE
jgi:hypothetical protein